MLERGVDPGRRRTASGRGGWGRTAGAAAVLAAGTAPIVFAAVAVGLVEGTGRAALGGAAKACIIFMPTLWLGVVWSLRLRDPDSEAGRRLGRVSNPLLLIFVQALLWTYSAPIWPSYSRERPWRVALSGELRTLANAQEYHYAEVYRYAGSTEELRFPTEEGIRIEIEATDRGWAARATVEASPEQSCTMYHGAVVEPLRTTQGRAPLAPHEAVCDPPPPLDSLGPLGGFLREYHAALAQRLRGISFY